MSPSGAPALTALACLATLTAGCGSGDQGASGVGARARPALEKVGTFDEPIYVAQPPGGDDGRLYVVERAGRIRVIEPDGTVRPDPFLDIHRRVYTEGEGAMISVAFPPDFERSHLLYVTYAGRDHRLHLDEYTLDRSGERADPDSRRPVLAIDHPNDIHWGGLALFGPDGHLYLGTGDGGPVYPIPPTAQDPDSPLGKLLRVDVHASSSRPYSVYALGLRNPWRFSFDRATGDLWIGDVGDFTQEEIDHLAAGRPAGANLGWPDLEGTAQTSSEVRAPGAIPPVLTYARTGKPDDPYCAVTGGYVVRDPELSSLRGSYLYGDFCQGHIRSLHLVHGEARDDRETGLVVPKLASFGEDAAGRIYAVSLDGPVYRLIER